MSMLPQEVCAECGSDHPEEDFCQMCLLCDGLDGAHDPSCAFWHLTPILPKEARVARQFYIPRPLDKRMDEVEHLEINWSNIVQKAVVDHLNTLEAEGQVPLGTAERTNAAFEEANND